MSNDAVEDNKKDEKKRDVDDNELEIEDFCDDVDVDRKREK